MSAFIVSHDHIDALVTFALAARVCYREPNGSRTEINRANATEVGMILLQENERSIRARYPEDDEPETSKDYRFEPIGALYVMPAPKAAAWIKSGCDCYDYQACETDDYSHTLAAAIIEAIRAEAIRKFPTHDAPWELTREHFAKLGHGKVVALSDLIALRGVTRG